MLVSRYWYKSIFDRAAAIAESCVEPFTRHILQLLTGHMLWQRQQAATLQSCYQLNTPHSIPIYIPTPSFLHIQHPQIACTAIVLSFNRWTKTKAISCNGQRGQHRTRSQHRLDSFKWESKWKVAKTGSNCNIGQRWSRSRSCKPHLMVAVF